MRLVRGLLLSTMLVSGAQAADYLRGAFGEPSYRAPAQSSASYDWSGYYFGGTGNWSAANIRSSSMGTQLALAGFPHLSGTNNIASLVNFPNGTARGTGYGAFVGYNTMWDDVVIGVEVDYNRTKVNYETALIPIARTVDGNATQRYGTVLSSGNQKVTIKDYGLARVRIGAAYGRFLPYITFGAGLASIETKGTLVGSTTEYNLDTTNNVWVQGGTLNVNVSRKNAKTSWGYAFGAGLDVSLIDNVFLRGHWEYASFGGNNSTRVDMHTLKAGAGVKF